MSGTTTIIKQISRSFTEEGRDFTVTYQLGSKQTDTCATPKTVCAKTFISASLVEQRDLDSYKETQYNLDFLHLDEDTSLHLFEVIAQAEDPVLPVHLPEIVRDQLSAFDFYEINSAVKHLTLIY